MNIDSEETQHNKFLDLVNTRGRDIVVLEPSFKVYDMEFELEFMSKQDEYKLKRLFEFLTLKANNKNTSIDDIKELIATEFQNLSKEVKISNKKLITTAEFAEIYGIPEKTQGTMRKRHKDPIPYIQTASGGNVSYDMKDVDKWHENYKMNG